MQNSTPTTSSNINKTIIFTSCFIFGIISYLTETSIFFAILLAILTTIAILKKIISPTQAILFYLIYIISILNCNFKIKNYDDLVFFAPTNATITGKILTIPTTNNPQKTKFYLQTETLETINTKPTPIKGKTLVTIYDQKDNFAKLKISDKVKLTGNFRTPTKAQNPSQFDYANYLKSHNTFTLLYVKPQNWELLESPKDFQGKFLQKLNDTRYQILKTQNKFIQSPNIEILGGIVFGDDAINPPDEIKNSFINSGLLHILAASGMNVSIIFGLWFFLGTKLRINRKFVTIIGAILVAFYTLMTGLGPSVLRAAIMLEFIILGKLINRNTNSLSLIFVVAFLMLLFEPMMIKDIGFQLSFIVTFALIFYSEPILNNTNNKITFAILSAIFVPLIAQLWAAPIQMFYFNTFATYSIFANFLITPFIIIISFLGFLSSILSMLPFDQLTTIVGKTTSLILNPIIDLLIKISNYFSDLPNSLITTFHPSIIQIILYYTALITIGSSIKNKLKNKTLIFYTIILILILGLSFIKYDKKELEILAFSVGNADSFLIKTPRNKYIMIDSARGLQKNSYNTYSQADAIINKYLKDNGIKTIDILLLTHFDTDHSGGAVDIMNTIKINKLMLNQYKDNSQTTKHILNTASNKKIKIIYPQNNTIIHQENNLNIKTFLPIQKNSDNENSIINLLSYKNFEMLFMGDASVSRFEEIKNYLTSKDIEILKNGHHGANNTVSTQMLKELTPDISIIPTGTNPYGHPTKETLNTLIKNNVQPYRTDTLNAIKITTNGEFYKIYKFDNKKKKFYKITEVICNNKTVPASN